VLFADSSVSNASQPGCIEQDDAFVRDPQFDSALGATACGKVTIASERPPVWSMSEAYGCETNCSALSPAFTERQSSDDEICNTAISAESANRYAE